MDAGEANYQKLQVKRYPARTIRETPEGNFWKRFRSPIVHQQIGAVSFIDYASDEPYHFAVTASTRVMLYDADSLELKRQFTRFNDKAYSGVLRPGDAKLLAAGGENGIVQVFDSSSRSLLRQFKAHTRAVHGVRFSPDKLRILSASDDSTVRLWDLTSGEQALRFVGHADYVRTASAGSAGGDIWATGSYDHTVKLWDARTGKATLTLDHRDPVEDVTFLPSGTLAVSAGGTSLCVWDLLSGGRLLTRLTGHQKTVTCVRVAPAAGSSVDPAPRLLAGSLDGHVKVYDITEFKVRHAARYPSPVMALGIAGDASTMAVGSADGALCVRRHARGGARPALTEGGVGSRADSGKAAGPPRRPRLNATNYRYFIRGQNEKAAEGEVRVAARRRAHLAPYDRLLRKFRHREALDAAIATRRPEVFAAVLEELMGRSALSGALGGRDAAGLLPLLSFLCRHIADPRHVTLLSNLCHRVLDIYAPALGQSPEVDAKLRVLRERVMLEVKLQEELAQLQGMLEPILFANMTL